MFFPVLASEIKIILFYFHYAFYFCLPTEKYCSFKVICIRAAFKI